MVNKVGRAFPCRRKNFNFDTWESCWWLYHGTCVGLELYCLSSCQTINLNDASISIKDSLFCVWKFGSFGHACTEFLRPSKQTTFTVTWTLRHTIQWPRRGLYMHNRQFEPVAQFTYLGSYLSAEEISSRIKKAQAAFWNLCEFF